MKNKQILKKFLIVLLFITIISLSMSLIFILSWINEVKDLNISLAESNIEFCKIYNNDNELISISNDDDYIMYSSIPQDLINAFISIEDKEFFNHNGLNYKRIIGATLKNIQAGGFVEGASTITQQLVKNKYLSNEKSIERKVKEAYLSKKIESIESKQKILETYLNTIYFGSGAYGIKNASTKYFNKDIKELTLNECSILAGIIKSPNNYSPINNIEKCKQRRNLVLSEMLKDGYITQEEYDLHSQKEIEINEGHLKNKISLYNQFALMEASKILNLPVEEILNKRYRIFTYQESDIQKNLDQKIYDDKFYPKNQFGNIADSLAMISDNKTRGVVAVSGRSNYNLVNLRRQPGSLVKPILVYTPAFEEKIIYPCSEILDEKISFGDYKPQNVSNKYYGYVSIKDAVAKSLNIPAIKLCEQLGLNKCKEYGELAGLQFAENDLGLAIALGGFTDGVTIQTILDSYSPLYLDGNYEKSVFVKSIISPNNKTITNDSATKNQYCNASSAYLMTESLIYATQHGTSKKLYNNSYQIASKTGTVNIKNTNLNSDAYCLAYTTKHSICTWLGNYSMDNLYHLDSNNNGGTYATQIVKEVFDDLYNKDKPSNFVKPDSILYKSIDVISLKNDHEVLLLEDGNEKYKRKEIFDIENLPPKSSRFININLENFQLTQEGNSIKISIDAEDYIEYDIYKKSHNSNNATIFEAITNNKGIQTIYDNNINQGEIYTYYIVAKINEIGLQTESRHKTIKVEKSYEQLLNNMDYMTYIFS